MPVGFSLHSGRCKVGAGRWDWWITWLLFLFLACGSEFSTFCFRVLASRRELSQTRRVVGMSWGNKQMRMMTARAVRGSRNGP